MSKKLIGTIASFALVLSMVGGSVAQAAALTSAQVSAIVSLLQSFGADSATVANVTASLNGQPTSGTVSTPVSSGYTFAKDLAVGSKGADVTALQNFLGVTPATGYFGSLTKAAVIKYQTSKGITPASGSFGLKTRASVNGSATTVVVPGTVANVTGVDLKVTLAPTSPVAGAIVAGSAIADLAEYTFQNTSAVSAVVTNVTLQRMGVSDDATLKAVYLYNGAKRLTDSATVSSGKITFNAPMGLFTVPAGSSMVVAVRSDILESGTSNSGQIVSVSLTNVSANGPVVNAVVPVSGASMTVVISSTKTVANFSVSTTPTTSDVDPQSDYVMWQNTLNVSNHDAVMKSFTLRQIGSVATADLGNFRLFVDGTQVGATVPSMDANGYVVFDLSLTPKALTQTSHIIKMVGDIIGGSGKYFSFSLRQASDVMVMDSQLGINVLATATAGIPSAAGNQTVNPGTLTITKKTDSPSGNVTKDASSQVLGRFEFKAAGEPMKVETLKVNFLSGDATLGALRNGMLFVNGSQIGSTADIASSSLSTEFNLGSSLVVYPGTPVLVEIKADIFDNNGTNNISDGDAITANFVAGTANVQRMVSLSYVPSSTVPGNQITVSQGALSLTKSSSFANKTIVVPQTAMKLGEYVLSTNSTEDINLNTITLRFDGATASTSAASLSDVYVVYGNKITSVKSTVATTSDNSYSINYVLPANTSLNMAVYGTLAASTGLSDVIVTKLNVSGQTVMSGQTATIAAAVTGQVISVTTGSLSVSKDATTPVSDLIAVSSNPLTPTVAKIASYKFEAQSDDYTVTELALKIDAASVGNVSGFVLKNGSTILKDFQAVDSTGFATSTLNFQIPANSSKVIDVYANLNVIGTPNNATSSSKVQSSLVYYKKQSSGGVQSTATSSTLLGNAMYVFKSKPTVNVAALPSTDITNASKIARFTVTADAAGSIAWNKIEVNVTKTYARVALTNIKLFDESTGLEVSGVMSSSSDLAATTTTSGTLTFVPTTEEQVGATASKTYYVKATVTTDGSLATGDNVTTSIVATGDQAASTHAASVATSSLVWSDMSVALHSTSTTDWNTDYLVKNMSSLDSQKIQF